MYARFVLAIQVILMCLSLNARGVEIHTLEGGRPESNFLESGTYRLVDEQRLKAYIFENVRQIESIVKTAQSSQKKLEMISERVQKVALFRSQNWSKSAFVEQQMDLEIKPYESFPRAQEYRRERCSQYKNRISVDWEPQAAEMGAVQKGVARALRVLREICSS